jgi:hypothetical protein
MLALLSAVTAPGGAVPAPLQALDVLLALAEA